MAPMEAWQNKIMVKIPRSVGIAIALAGLLLFGGFAYGVSKIKFDNVRKDVKTYVTPFQEAGGVILNENLSEEFLNFEYQFFLGEYYSRNNEYEKSLSCYEKAIASARATLGDKSYFTFAAYDAKALAEGKNSHFEEAHEDFNASLKALPEEEEYAKFKWSTESWLIYTSSDKTAPENIPFYRQHLALTEKLLNDFVEHKQLVYVLSLLGKSLDNDEKHEESEPIWKRMLSEARAENYPHVTFEPWLLDYCHHEVYAGHFSEAEQALSEALNIATHAKDDQMIADVMEEKGNSPLRQNDLVKAEIAFQENLLLRKKLNNKAELRDAYDWLTEVARRRADLAKREEYMTAAFQLVGEPWQKIRRLPALAFVAAQRKKMPLADEYVKQWSQLTKTKTAQGQFIYDTDLKNLLVLYPALNEKQDKASQNKSDDRDLSNLELCKISPYRSGYYLTRKQLDRIMNTM